MFHLFKHRANAEKEKVAIAYEKGRKVGDDILAVADEFFDPRIKLTSDRMTAIFHEQLAKIGSVPEIAPLKHLAVEGEAFADEYDTAMEHLYSVFTEQCSEVIKIADMIGIRELLDQYIGQKIIKAKTDQSAVVVEIMADMAVKLDAAEH